MRTSHHIPQHHSDSGKWARLLKKLAEHVASLGGGDAEELASELDEAMSAQLGAAPSFSQTLKFDGAHW